METAVSSQGPLGDSNPIIGNIQPKCGTIYGTHHHKIMVRNGTEIAELALWFHVWSYSNGIAGLYIPWQMEPVALDQSVCSGL